MTLGNAAKAKLRLIVWCRGSGHQAKPDPARLARRHGLAEAAALSARDAIDQARQPLLRLLTRQPAQRSRKEPERA